MAIEVISEKLVEFKAFVDVHTHPREPGGEAKSTIRNSSQAAVAGGYQAFLDMGNNIRDGRPYATNSIARVREKFYLAQKGGIYCDYGVIAVATPDEVEKFDPIEVDRMRGSIFAIKRFANDSTGHMSFKDKKELARQLSTHPKDILACFHAESYDGALDTVLDLVSKFGLTSNICHLSTRKDLSLIKQAIQSGVNVSTEATPPHLVFTNLDVEKLPGGFGLINPRIGTTEDREAMWEEGIIGGLINTIATDNAPHTLHEKLDAANPPSGMPSTEVAVSVMIKEFTRRGVPLDRMQQMLHDNPIRRFRIPVSPDSYSVWDLGQERVVRASDLYTQCRWSPFEGMPVLGKLIENVLEGEIIYKNGQFIGNPKGKVITPQ